ncbi:MAG: hypothetical protein C0442_08320 [Chlorobiaceae bacterium]|nr:hypothetical protein [Chlorobiaceae bacterium]
MLIAHISDLHINSHIRDSKIKETELLLKKIIELKVDHLVLTGDLSDLANEEDFEILRKLLLKYNLMSGERLSIVIGNHDIFGGLKTAEDIFTFPDYCSGVNYENKVTLFNSYFKEAFDHTIYKSESNYYPFAKLLDTTLLVGVNSIAHYSKLKNPFASNGKVSKEQLSELTNIMNDFGSLVEKRVLLIHHHFNKIKSKFNLGAKSLWAVVENQTMKLKNKKKLLNLISKFNFDLVLHGHFHENKNYKRKEINFLNSGGTIKNGKADSLLYNLIDIESNQINTNTEEIFFMTSVNQKKRSQSKLLV